MEITDYIFTEEQSSNDNILECLLQDTAYMLFHDDSRQHTHRDKNELIQIANTCMEYYFDINNQHETMMKEINDILEYICSLKLPYCYEYARAHFIERFKHIEMDLTELQVSLSNFPSDCEYYSVKFSENPNSILAIETMKNLNVMLDWYKKRLLYIKDIMNRCADYGKYIHECSQIVPKNCAHHF